MQTTDGNLISIVFKMLLLGMPIISVLYTQSANCVPFSRLSFHSLKQITPTVNTVMQQEVFICRYPIPNIL